MTWRTFFRNFQRHIKDEVQDFAFHTFNSTLLFIIMLLPIFIFEGVAFALSFVRIQPHVLDTVMYLKEGWFYLDVAFFVFNMLIQFARLTRSTWRQFWKE